MPGFDELYTSDAKKIFDSNDAELLVLGDSLTIGFCVSSAEDNRLDKTAFLSAYEWLGGTLREESSIIAPTITVEHDGFPDWNYAYIPNFGRYYFITDIVSVRTNLWRISFRNDPMMSYKDEIKGTYAMIGRNEHEFDRQVNDEAYPTEYRKSVEEYTPANVDPDHCIKFTPGIDLSLKPHIAVTTINYYQDNSGYVFDLDPGYLPKVNAGNFVGPSRQKTYAMTDVEFAKLIEGIIDDDTKATFLLSAIVYPYEIEVLDTYDEPQDVFLGKSRIKWMVGDVEYILRAHSHPSPLYAGAKLIEFVAPSIIDFHQLEPYCMYELFVPYSGWIKFPIDVCRGDNIIVFYGIDHINGTATGYVYDKTKHRLLWTGPAQIGNKLATSTTNALENQKTMDAANLNLGMGMLSSLASVGIGIASENPVAVAGGILSAGSTITSYINTRNNIFNRAQATAGSFTTGLTVPTQVRMRVTKMVATDYGSAFSNQYGKPLNKIRRIGSLSGYTVVNKVHLEIPGAYPSEVSEIEALLMEGFIA